MLSACGAHYGAGETPITYFWKESSGTRQHVPVRLKLNGYYEKVSSFWLSMRHKSRKDAIENAQLVEIVMNKKGE